MASSRLSETFLALIVLLVLQPCGLLGSPGRRCDGSGYCSLGKVQSFRGDISSLSGLRKALDARSFRNEVIISIFTSGHLAGALQFYDSMRSLGLGNLLLLSTNATMCQTLLGVTPELGCGWSSAASLKLLAGYLQLWHLRIATAARAVRMGYNVLVADTDIIFFNDPYAFLKQPPFSRAQLLMHREPTHAWGLNCGTYYVQDARPNGPTAWFLAEVADRQLRWLEDGGTFLTSLGLDVPCMTWDQELFDAVFISSIVGRPVVGTSSWSMCTVPGLRPEVELTQLTQHISAMFRSAIAAKGRRAYMAVPPTWSSLTGSNGTGWVSAELRVPHAAGSWPEDLGGPVYPQQRGPASIAFQQQLAEAGGLLWPDPDDPAQAAASAAAAPETFAFLPDWFVFGWQHRGRRGYWEARKEHEVQQVMGHMLYVRVTPSTVAKRMLTKYLGQWNWSLQAQWKGNQAYVASTPAIPLPRLLAYDLSAVRLEDVGSFRRLRELMRGLMQAAVATGRAVLWPDLPCGLSYGWDTAGDTSRRPKLRARNVLPLRYDGWLHPYGPLDDLRCFNISYASGPCLFRGAGLTQVEFQHMLTVWGKGSSELLPGPHNTALSTVVLFDTTVPAGHGGGESVLGGGHGSHDHGRGGGSGSNNRSSGNGSVTARGNGRDSSSAGGTVRNNGAGGTVRSSIDGAIRAVTDGTALDEEATAATRHRSTQDIGSATRRLCASNMELGLINPDNVPELGSGTAVTIRDGGRTGFDEAAVAAIALRDALGASFGTDREIGRAAAWVDAGPDGADGNDASMLSAGHAGVAMAADGEATGEGLALGLAAGGPGTRVAGTNTAAAAVGRGQQPHVPVLRLGSEEFVRALELAGVAQQRVVYLAYPVSIDLSRLPHQAAEYQRIEQGCVFLADSAKERA